MAVPQAELIPAVAITAVSLDSLLKAEPKGLRIMCGFSGLNDKLERSKWISLNGFTRYAFEAGAWRSNGQRLRDTLQHTQRTHVVV